jgi:hypothetical protein
MYAGARSWPSDDGTKSRKSPGDAGIHKEIFKPRAEAGNEPRIDGDGGTHRLADEIAKERFKRSRPFGIVRMCNRDGGAEKPVTLCDETFDLRKNLLAILKGSVSHKELDEPAKCAGSFPLRNIGEKLDERLSVHAR